MNSTLVTACSRWPAPFMPNWSLHLFRPNPEPEKIGIDPVDETGDKPFAAIQEAIVCRQCLHKITASTERKIINGAHAHAFANPEGIVFEIACYRHAWGCHCIGPSSPEFTWFAGFVWRIAVCSNCRVHLGWRFSASDGLFFHGLIAKRLVFNGG